VLRYMWLIVKYGALIAVAVFAIPRLTTWLPFTLQFAHPEQDNCTFGPVSNAEYCAMLLKARSLQRWKWLGPNAADELLKQFLEVSKGSSSPYVKIAAIHAVLRALGAEFRNNGLFSQDIFNRVSTKGGAIPNNYALPVPRIGVFSVWPGNAWFIGALKGPRSSTDGPASPRQGQVYFVVHLPNPIDPIPNTLWWGEISCPPVPPQDLQTFLSD
jgi:hypothetical protein